MLLRVSAGVLGVIVVSGLGLVLVDRRVPAPNRVTKVAGPAAAGDTKARARDVLRASPVAFERNTGQHPAADAFVARGPGYLMSLRPNEARVALQTRNKPVPAREDSTLSNAAPPRAGVQSTEVRLALVGANANASGRLEGLREARANYFLGPDPARWRTDVQQFDGVRFDDVYPGVDLVYYGRETTIEYDLVVRPGASPASIELAFSGAREVKLAHDGALVLTTALGELRQPAPVLYQERDGRREPVGGRFVLRGDNHVAFDVDDYDRSAPLVIDPVLQYSTYFGGSGYDIAYEIEVDAAGAMYIAGETVGTLPVNGFDTTPNGSWDLFVSKFNSAGALVYSTYYGSTADDSPSDLALDSSGSVYVVGYTGGDVPTTAGALQTVRNGADIFVFKLTSTGLGLSYATYLGSGPNFDNPTSLAVDSLGAAYIGGSAGSAAFPTTVGAWDRSFSGGNDGFIAKLNPAGSQLQFSTYLGGSSTESVQGIAVHALGTIYVTGTTNSCDFPTTAGAADTTCNDGSDVFVTALLPLGGGLVWSTYFGGSAADYTNRIAVAPTGEVVVVGGTSSSNLPAALNTIRCCDDDGFIARIASGGGRFVFSRYIGGYGSDNVLGLALDGAGAALITGWTEDNDAGFPITIGAFRPDKDSGVDAFITKVTPQGWVDYSTYVGGTQSDGGTDIAVGHDGAVYLTGWTDTGTDSTAFPVTFDALFSFGSGNFDAFLMRFDAPIDRSLQIGSSFPEPIPVVGSVDSSAWLEDDGATYFGIIEAVSVSVYVTHTFDSDLSLSLIGPDGTTVLLTQALGGSGDNYGTGCGQEYQRTTFSDTAATSINVSNAPFVGAFRPLQPLSAFAGRSGAGQWRLRATDSVELDSGAIQCWTAHIRFRSPAVTSISPTSGSANGGTTVTITGSNFAADGDMQPEVRIGGIPVTRTGWSPTSFTGVTSARYSGLSDVVVTDALGRSGVLRNGFTYAGTQTLTVNGAGFGSGTVTTPAGFAPVINCTITGGVASGTCAQNYTYGVNVTLNATPTGGGTFTGWSGACSGASCTVAMTASRTVTATFTPPGQQLTVTGGGSGSGVVTSQAGLSPAINCTITSGVASGGCSASYAFNTSVTLTATPAGGGTFTSWVGSCSGSGTCPLVMSQARAVTATFTAPPQTLTVSGGGTGSGVVTSQAGLSPAINCTITNGVASGACSQSYAFNTSVTLTATPSGGGTFTSWSGSCSGSGTCPLVMSQARAVTATFTAPPQTLTVSGGGTGSGVVTSQAGLSPAINCTITNGVASGACAQTYPFNTSVTLTATPTGAGSFSSWGGACTGGAGCTVVMSQARSVTAVFAVAPLTLTIVGAGTGGGAVASQAGLFPAISCSIVGSSTAGTCSAAYPLNTVVTLTATPGVGSFAGWSGPCSGLGSCTVTMSQARVVTATFEAPRTLTINGAGTGSGAITSQAGLSPAISCAITGGVAGGACSQAYPFNTSVTLTVTPAAGSTFTGWSGACSAATATCTLIMSQARTAAATFTGAPSPSMTIETMTPASGSTAGGTLVTLRGNGLSGGTVTVGGRPATSRRQIDARTMTFLTPSGNPGAASMTLVGPSGSVSRSFTYLPPEDGSIPGARNARFDYDGRYLVFESAVALVADDTNGVADIYVVDRRIPTAPPVRLSVTSQKLQALGGESVTPAISSTGRIVAFASRASNLVPADTNGAMDVFVHDRDTDGDGVYDETGAVATTRVSIGPASEQADGPSTEPTISGSGRWVAFVSTARNLRPGATDNEPDVFVRDRTIGTTVAVSLGIAGASGAPVLSLDGRFIAFESLSPALVANDTNGVMDVFLHDRDPDEDGVFDEAGAAAITRISVPSSGGQGLGGPSSSPSITQEGRWTVFESLKTNLVAHDTNAVSDVFIHDRVLHTTTRLSRTPDGEEDTSPAVSPVISANGAVVHYVREASASGASFARSGVVAAAAGDEFGDNIAVPDPTNPNPPPPLPPDPVGTPTVEPCVSGNGQAGCSEKAPDKPGEEPDTDFDGPPPPAPDATIPVIFDWSSRRGYWDDPATVDIEGQGFGPTSRVFVEGQEVATELRGQSLRIHLPALSPPAILAPIDRPFEVRNGSLASNTAVFSYDPSPGAGQPPARSNPFVDSLTVTSGPTSGNTSIAVEGGGFEAATVIVDGLGVTPNAAQSTATRLVFNTPPHTAGTVAVAVRNGDGVTAAHAPAFEYVLAAVTQAPVVSGVNPNPALGAGNTPLTISGQNFALGATVTVAGVPASQVVVVSNTQIQALAPPRPPNVPIGAPVDLTVTVAGRSGTLPGVLSYIEFDPAAASPDGDGDGLPRNWEGFFGLSDANATDASADADGDGRTNAQEFADGTHPLSLYTRYFAEGATGPYFSTRIAMANPNASPATVLLRVLTDAGLSLPKYLVVPAMSTRTIRVADEVPGAASVAFASVIEADREIVVDRSMFWNADHFGSSAETSVPAPSLTWYLAEGATGGDETREFFLFYLLQNPSLTTAAQVRIRYLKRDGVPIEATYSVAPRSRLTIQVDEVPGLASVDVSGVIESLNNVPVIAERAMYLFDRANPARGFIAGHESAGVTAPATSWFLAEGATGPFFDLFVLLANPNPQPAELRLTYLLESGVNIVKTHIVPGNSRRTIYVGSEDPLLRSASVATRVDSLNGVPVVVERAMWWPSGAWQEAHNSAGSTTTGVKWGLAEGESGGSFNTRTYILIANTSSTTATVRVTLLFQGTRAPVEKEFTVLPNSRKTIDVSTEYPTSGGFDFGAVIESLNGEQIVVERAMYSDALGVTWAAGTNALGTRLR